MRTSETWLMHPVTDLLRFHYSGSIPDGTGTLWDYGGKTRTVRYTESGKPDSNGKVWDSRHVGGHKLLAVRSVHLAGRPGTRSLLVCRERPGLEPRPETPRIGNPPAERGHLVDRPFHQPAHAPDTDRARSRSG